MTKKITIFTLSMVGLLALYGCQQKNETPTEEPIAKTEADVQVKIAKEKEKVQIEEKDLIKPGKPSDGATLYRDKLQKGCNMSGYALARKKTKEQWEEIAKNGKLAETIEALCPEAEFDNIWTPDIYEYLHQNAMGSSS
jgi:hypothetical protein